MIDNYDLVGARLASYNCFPDAKYRINSGGPAQEERLSEKLRQYWADTNISNAEKLEGFDYDLSDFDPRNTTPNELIKIALALYGMGIIDDATVVGLTSAGDDFDRYGNQINMDKKVDAIEDLHRSLEFTKDRVSKGFDFSKEMLTMMTLDMTVMLALQERAEMMRKNKSLIDIKV